MLPVHLTLIASVMKTYGYNFQLMSAAGQAVVDTGLKYTHNDTCYPAILVIGQFIETLRSGKYDPHKCALILFQTGGGCRASNYIPLVRKALKKAGLEYVPVIPAGLSGIEKHPGFKMTVPMMHALLYAILYGDLMMSLSNQTKPFEVNRGDADALVARWTEHLAGELSQGSRINYGAIKRNYAAIIEDFAAIPMKKRNAVKVGVVGEIFVKYSPLGNNNLEQFLLDEGAQVVVPGLVDFCLYTVYNSLMDYQMYRRGKMTYHLWQFAWRFLCGKRQDVNELIIKNGVFEPWTPFEQVPQLMRGYISPGVKMGEGWLLTAEMLELAHSGVKNIVCTQPFGCLPNHICGKGMMKPIKEKNPDINIVAIDYDASASKVNQENRLKLMLFNARRQLQ